MTQRTLVTLLAAGLILRLVTIARPALAEGVELPGTQPSDGSGHPDFPPFRNGAAPGTFDPPGICDNCHADYRASGESVYEPYDSWAASMMAMAGRDPLFWAAVDVANQDDADHLGGVGVGDLCLRCHVPRGWYEGRSSCVTAWGEEFDGACMEGSPDVADNDFEGITCNFCHRMYDASVPPPGDFNDPAAPRLENGQVYLSSDADTMRGPYADADPRRHDFEDSPFHRSAQLCGQCHDVTNPARTRRDPASGADLGYAMPVERTWSEYSQSVYADPAAPEHATCQACHMPEADLDGDGTPDPGYACSQEPGLRGPGTALEGPLRTHFLAGGSTWMLGVLRGEHGTSLDRVAAFDAAIEASQRVLRQAADLHLSAPPQAQVGAVVDVVATTTNRTGHKLPTGYPEGRRAWLQVAAGTDLDADGVLGAGEITFESGAYDATTAELERDPQAEVYEILLGVWDWNGTGECDHVDGTTGREMFHFVLNDCVISDNRIPPLGFRPNDETMPVGHVYRENPDRPGTLANWDDTAYAVPVTGAAGETLIVEARLLYQSTSKDFVEFLRDENRSTCDPIEPDCDPTGADARPNRGERMHDLWVAHGRAAPIVLATATASVEVVASPTGACCVGGECIETDEADCVERGGTYEGDATSCAEVSCAAPTGACCVGGECIETDEADCVERGGTYEGDATSCAEVSCAAPTGACCVGGECIETDATDCAGRGGTYEGDATSCAEVSCSLPPPGEATDLRVTDFDAVRRELSVTYEPACDAVDHAIVWGPLRSVSSYISEGITCGLGTSGSATFDAATGSTWFVIVGRGELAEGSYGRDSFGVERPERDETTGCDLPQDLSSDC